MKALNEYHPQATNLDNYLGCNCVKELYTPKKEISKWLRDELKTLANSSQRDVKPINKQKNKYKPYEI